VVNVKCDISFVILSCVCAKVCIQLNECHTPSGNKSPLLLTNLRDAVPRAHLVIHRCRRSVW